MSCHTSSPVSSAASYNSGHATCACSPHEVEVGVQRELHVTRELAGAGVAERHACRALVRALEEQALAVDPQYPMVEPHLPQTGSQLAAVARHRRLLAIGGRHQHRDFDVLERLGSQSTRPPQRGRSTVTVHSTRFVPAARVCSASWSVAPIVVRSAMVLASRVSSTARNATTACSLVASAHKQRSRSMRTGPVSVTWTGRQMPPGFQAGSRQSPCWNSPVRFRLADKSLGLLHVTSTAIVCSRGRATRP